jgi:hypothetical protein
VSRHSRRVGPDRTAPRPLPRGTVPVALGSAVVLATLALTADASRAADPAPEQPPAGAVLVIVAQSDGLTWLPVGQAVVPPTACIPS